MKASRIIGAIATLLFVSACKDLIVPDYNNTSIDDLTSSPTPTKITQAAQGLLVGTRVGIGEQNGYVSLLGILGRESYNFDPADPRFITEMLIGPLDGGSPAFGGNLFAAPYRNIRNANLLLGAVDKVVGLSASQKSAVQGFAKTIQALDFLNVINTRDDLGAPLDVNIGPTDDPAPIVSKAAIFTAISTLLDDGLTALNAGGTAFPFALSPGFSSFATPAEFTKFNRALKARVEAYRGNYGAVLTALSGSFLDTNAPITLGAYHSYSTGSGDTPNALFDPTGRAILAHPSIVTDAEKKPDGTLDARALAKVTKLPDVHTVQGISTDLVFTIYNSNTAPIPIIRNEELILLRAEARYFTSDVAGALTDINLIRTTSGGLAPRGPFTSSADFVTELLKQRRYSLLFEGGHRWIDTRRFGLLSTLPKALPTHNIFSRFPFPEAECLARVPAPTQGCT
ncbi:MAG: RagB/SusD family nutrient uptake outer membrane protein [Gemmatimonadetes bacterium]|nr:MAG: RagB/SusD family nutrient uptake outer membrane protein [Gemmatimonadota bacterium]PYP54364.1 MAG: RagB/SusD family nutrient uptake outer membrane protein [Gemmatimonadota bacterium]